MRNSYPLGNRDQSLIVIHPRFRYGDLVELSEQGHSIERSDHIGNLHASGLITATDPNVKTRQLLVNTSNGDDTEYYPRHILVDDIKFPLATKSQGTTIVGKIKINCTEKILDDVSSHLHSLDISPLIFGQNMADIHIEALRSASNNSEILTKRDMVKQIPQAVRSMMQFVARNEGVTRYVQGDGKIQHSKGSITEATLSKIGIYGLENENGGEQIYEGALIPLAASLAMDIVYNASLGNEIIYHQAGSDMRRYTHNPDLMRMVALIAGIGLKKLGIDSAPIYNVVDTANIAHIANNIKLPENIRHDVSSQYDALKLHIKYGFIFASDRKDYKTELWLDN